MKLNYLNFGVRLVEKEHFATSKDYTFIQGVPKKIDETDAKIILEKTSGEFEAEAPERRGTKATKATEVPRPE